LSIDGNQNRSKSINSGDNHHPSAPHLNMHQIKIEKPQVVHGNIQHADGNHDIVSKMAPASSVRSGSINGRSSIAGSSVRTTTTVREEINRLKSELEREKKARQEAEHTLRQTKAALNNNA
jgi:hypothetical protein